MLITVTIRSEESEEGLVGLGQDPEPLSGRGPALLDLGSVGSGGAMARQCAIVVQRCTQAREGEEEGGSLGQLGE